MAALLAALVVPWALGSPAIGDSFSNPTALVGEVETTCGPYKTAPQYPSVITVTGLQGTVSDVNVTLHDFAAQRRVGNPPPGPGYPTDADFLLEGPDGTNLVIASDLAATGNLVNLVGVDINVDDSAADPLPVDTDLTSNSTVTGRPTDNDSSSDEVLPVDQFNNDLNCPPDDFSPVDTYSFAGPTPSGNTALSAFNGINPNGDWKLYMVDDYGGVEGIALDGGWSMEITVEAPPTTVTTEAPPTTVTPTTEAPPTTVTPTTVTPTTVTPTTVTPTTVTPTTVTPTTVTPTTVTPTTVTPTTVTPTTEVPPTTVTPTTVTPTTVTPTTVTPTTVTTAPPTTATTVPGDTQGVATVSDTTPDPGQTVTVSGSGYVPESGVDGVLFSDPVVLGHAVADATGAVSFDVIIPADTAAGEHELHLVGTNRSGGTHRNTTTVTVNDTGSPSTGGTPPAAVTRTGELARTGDDPSQTLALAGVLVVGGVLLLLVRKQSAQKWLP